MYGSGMRGATGEVGAGEGGPPPASSLAAVVRGGRACASRQFTRVQCGSCGFSGVCAVSFYFLFVLQTMTACV